MERVLPCPTPLVSEIDSRAVPDVSGDLALGLAKFQQTSAHSIAELLPGYEAEVRASRRTKKEERGLPVLADLIKLAQVYLDVQRRLWPDIFHHDSLPALTDDADQLAESYSAFFQQGNVESFVCYRPAGTKAIAGCYLRYSCENSNPRSLDDQLQTILGAAKIAGHFIPWRYVLADSSVSGTIAVRRGYLIAKDLMQTKPDRPALETLYVYDMSRASRDIIESHKLARFARSVGKNILGVADGFDLSSSHADIQLLAMSMYSHMFISSARERVRTGMKGAATRGTSTGKPPLGYKLVPKLDASGRPQVNAHERVLMERAVDPQTSQFVQSAFHMVGVEHRSYEHVREMFNKHHVGGKNNWWPIDIRTILANPTYIGLHVFNRTRKWTDPETGRPMVAARPRSEWVVIRRPEWAIISKDLWKAARRRCYAVKAASPHKGPKPGFRQKLHPRTLFSGTLMCAHCMKPLVLFRGGDNKFFHCPRGKCHTSGCQLRSKAVRPIEEAILRYIRQELLGVHQLEKLLQQANHFLAEEIARPRVDPKPLAQELKEIERTLMKLTDAIAGLNPKAVQTVVSRIEKMESHKRKLTHALREAEMRPAPPSPLTMATVQSAVENLWMVLSQEPAMAAPVLRKLTGDILVHAEPIPRRKRQLRVARFRGNVVPLLASSMSTDSKTPDSYSLDFLTVRNWSFNVDAQIRIESLAKGSGDTEVRQSCKYYRYAQSVVQMRGEGLTWKEIGKRLGIEEATAQDAYAFGMTGKRPFVLKREEQYKTALHVCSKRLSVLKPS